eukprot:NODE_174_length_14184_cov_0.583671.p2 type:complete len:465 gc:universal NODE_174_length_14184_cov_0.583671:2753-1359(-)
MVSCHHSRSHYRILFTNDFDLEYWGNDTPIRTFAILVKIFFQTMSQVHLTHSTQFRVYPERWFQLFIFSLFTFSNATLWISFASIATISSNYYSVSLTAINWLSLIFMLVFIPLGFISTHFINHHLRYSLLIGAILNCIGAWIRVLAGTNFTLVMVGQIIAAMAQPFALNTTTKLASTWFELKQRTVANAIMSLSNPIGIAFAMVLVPSLVILPSDLPIPLLILAILSTISLFFMLFIKNQPKSSPGLTTAISHIPLLQALQSALHNPSYCILAICFGLQVGLFNALTTDLQQILDPFGYTPDEAGYCSAGFIVFGLLMAGMTSPILDKYGHQVRILKLFVNGLTICYVALALSLHPNLFILILIINCLLGGFTFSLLPLALELGVEADYPNIPEGTSNNILWLLGQVFGIIILSIMDQLQLNHELVAGVWMCAGISLFTGILALKFKCGTSRRDIEEAIDHQQ